LAHRIDGAALVNHQPFPAQFGGGTESGPAESSIPLDYSSFYVREAPTNTVLYKSGKRGQLAHR